MYFRSEYVCCWNACKFITTCIVQNILFRAYSMYCQSDSFPQPERKMFFNVNIFSMNGEIAVCESISFACSRLLRRKKNFKCHCLGLGDYAGLDHTIMSHYHYTSKKLSTKCLFPNKAPLHSEYALIDSSCLLSISGIGGIK